MLGWGSSGRSGSVAPSRSCDAIEPGRTLRDPDRVPLAPVPSLTTRSPLIKRGGTSPLSAPKSRDSLRLRRRFLPLPKNQKHVRNPNHHYFSKKYRDTPPICIAIRLQFILEYFRCPYALRKGEYGQYSSHLYRSTRPICIAIRLPFVSQYFWENLGGCGHRDVPQKIHAIF